VQINLHFG